MKFPFYSQIWCPELRAVLFADFEAAVDVEYERGRYEVCGAYVGGEWRHGVYRGGKFLDAGSMLAKLISDQVHEQARAELDARSGRLWELVSEKFSLMAAE